MDSADAAKKWYLQNPCQKVMKKIVLLLMLLLPAALFAQKKQASMNENSAKVKAVLEKSRERCQSIKSGYYEMSVYRKLSGYNDDLHAYETKCYFDKKGGNSLWDYRFNIFTRCTDENWYEPFTVVYDGGKLLRYTDKMHVICENPRNSEDQQILSLGLSLEVYLPFMNKEMNMWKLWFGGDYDFWLLGEKRVDDSLCYEILLCRNQKNRQKPTRNMSSNINEQCILWIDKETFLPMMYSEAWIVSSKGKGVVSFGYLKQKLNKFDENGFDEKQVDVSNKLAEIKK